MTSQLEKKGLSEVEVMEETLNKEMSVIGILWMSLTAQERGNACEAENVWWSTAGTREEIHQ